MCPDDFGDICSNMFFLIQGFDKAQMNKTMIPEIIKVRVCPLTRGTRSIYLRDKIHPVSNFI